jgi:1-acyl-sn-glycerol-3-phosphate acyltransferase
VLARSLLFNFAAYLNFLVQAVLFSPVLVLPERCFWPVGRFWVRSTLWLHRTIIGTNSEVRGREHIPQGGYIVASKHQSAWETLKLVELFPRPSFILKRQLLWVPLFGWYLMKARMVPVHRGKGSEALEAMTARAKRAIAEGRQIVIFPEGTRRPPLAPPEYRYGVTRLYRDLDVQCLPVALNSGVFWPRRSITQHRGAIVMECLAPIAPGLPPERFTEVLKEKLEAATAALVEEALAEHPDLRDGILSEPDAAPAATTTR